MSDLQLRAGQLSVTHTEADIVRITGLSRSMVRYWTKKHHDEEFHSLSHGGARNFSMTASHHTLSEAVLLTVVEMHPSATLEGLAKKMRQYGCRDINKAWVYRTFCTWEYTHKRLHHVQQHKFTQRNILRYIDHIFGIAELDPTKIKYLDESRFETRSNQHSAPHHTQFIHNHHP